MTRLTSRCAGYVSIVDSVVGNFVAPHLSMLYLVASFFGSR